MQLSHSDLISPDHMNPINGSYTNLKMQLGDYHLQFPKELIGDPQDSTDEYLRKLKLETPAVDLEKQLGKMRELCLQQHEMIRKLQLEVEIEHGRNKILRHDYEELRRAGVEATAKFEQEEEQITNKLLKKIDGLKREKGEIMTQMEQEEEIMAQNLEKRLTQLQKEKLELEIAMEQEQEFMVNRLNRQLTEMKKHNSSNNSLSSDTAMPPLMSNAHHSQMNEPDEELRHVRVKLDEVEKDHATRILEYQQEIQRLKQELGKLRMHDGHTPMKH